MRYTTEDLEKLSSLDPNLLVGRFLPVSRHKLGKPLTDDWKWNVLHWHKESKMRVQMGLRKLSQTEIGEKASPIQPVNRHLVGKIISSWEYDNCLNQNGLCGGPRTESTKLHIWVQDFILDAIRLRDDIGVQVHQSTIGRFFKMARLPLKLVERKCCRAFLPENVIYHREFVMAVATLDSRRLRFYDETSITGRPYGSVKGRAPPGVGITQVEELPANFRWSLCGLTCTKPGSFPLEVMAWEDVQTSSDVIETFRTWCARGAFEFGDIVVMDRAGTHSVYVTNLLAELLAVYGVMLIFTPKYSPECNPIELAWNKLKYILRYKHYRTTKWDSFASLLLACREISMKDMNGFYRHCGSGWGLE